ncbi:hypothetical protein DAI22_06g087550 [Oryza sativa Japonica Group]|nr:hypothetical protein DAI22_06g087550 [Oryza sativa Japonica Group]
MAGRTTLLGFPPCGGGGGGAVAVVAAKHRKPATSGDGGRGRSSGGGGVGRRTMAQVKDVRVNTSYKSKMVHPLTHNSDCGS